MDSRGYLIVEVTKDALGNVQREKYSWKGGPITYLDYRALKEDVPQGKTISIGPYKLLSLGFDHTAFDFKFVRVDYPFFWLHLFVHRASAILRLIGARTILTLAVWNLADHHPSVVPSINDIHAVQWIRKAWKKLTANRQ